MTNAELDDIIAWCRKKMTDKIISYGWYDRLDGNRREGYEMAMKATMSYLHSLKQEDNDNGEN